MFKNFLILTLTCSLGFAADAINGRWWVKQTPDTKIGYVVGYEDGIASGVAASGDTSQTTLNNANNVSAPNSTIGGVVTFLDEFFSHPENARLDIPEGIVILSLTIQGKSAADIDKRVRAMRMAAADQR
jgi:hypothetical protein